MMAYDVGVNVGKLVPSIFLHERISIFDTKTQNARRQKILWRFDRSNQSVVIGLPALLSAFLYQDFALFLPCRDLAL